MRTKYFFHILALSAIVSACCDSDDPIMETNCLEQASFPSESVDDTTYNCCPGCVIDPEELYFAGHPYDYAYPCFNPNNSDQIAYYRYDNYKAEAGWEIWVQDLCTGEKRMLVNDANYGIDWSVKDWIVYTATDQQIYKIKSNGDSLTRLTPSGDYNRYPKWDIKGERIAYECEESGDTRFIILNDRTGERDTIPELSRIEAWNWVGDNEVSYPFLEQDALGVPAIVAGIVLYPGLAMIGLFYLAKRVPRLLPLAVYPWIYLAAFSVINPQIFRWYLAPPLPAYFLCILVGAWALIDALTRSRRATPALALLGAAWLAFSLNAWTLHPDHGPDRPAPKMAWHKIELLYQQVAEELRAEYGVDDATLVGAGDIGAVGYFSRARILDTVGLVTPAVTAYYPVDAALIVPGGNYAVPPQLIVDYQPDYLILMEAFVRNGLAKDARFTARYTQEKFIPTDFYGTGMILYRLREDNPALVQSEGGAR